MGSAARSVKQESRAHSATNAQRTLMHRRPNDNTLVIDGMVKSPVEMTQTLERMKQKTSLLGVSPSPL